ncbi:MAG TPA: Zn-dependent hydrolase [Alphaproteobacteria bacterium]|nr:Zn-dependent hydrolase [Alphaproteobacteria bacterium]
MIAANPERVLQDLYFLRSVGTYKTGVHRPTLSADDMTTRRWLAEQLQAIGHDAHIDGVANVVGLSPAVGRKLLSGSHIESQNRAGWLDGALGVIYALEAARAVAEGAGIRDIGVDVMAFADEEGHFGSFFGSRSLTGNLTDEDIDTAHDRTHGTPMREALAAAGLAGVPRHRLDLERYSGFLEAHIEQGDSLEAEGLSIGVVTSIVAIWQYRVTFEGVQNHAGTTRMPIRKDAGVALRKLCTRIEELFPEIAGPRSVWTVGRITLDPGAPSIVPGGAEMLFQFRDADPETLLRLEAGLQQLVDEANANGPCTVTLENLSKSTPAVMSPAIQDALDAAADKFAPGKHVRMPSGAGHDAQVIAQHMPAGMLFVPSVGGISHHWTEDTSDEDIARGAQVFVDGVARLLQA